MGLIHALGFDHVEVPGIELAAAERGVFHSQGPGGVECRPIFHKQLRGFEFAIDGCGAHETHLFLGGKIANDRAFGDYRPGLYFGFNPALMANQQ